jgi:hypothetical protein
MPYRHQVAGKQRHDADDRQEARDPRHRGMKSVMKRPGGLVPIAIGTGTEGVGTIGRVTVGRVTVDRGFIEQPLRWPGERWLLQRLCKDAPQASSLLAA